MALEPGDQLLAHVFCQPSPERAKLERSLAGLPVELEWHQPDDGLHALPAASRVMHRMSFQRIFAVRELAERHDRLIYLDGDLLVRSSLRELWDVSLVGKPLGAVLDPLVPWVSCSLGPPAWIELGLPREMPYFNGGVMVIDAQEWMRRELTQRCVAQLERFPSTLRFYDQDALNLVVAGDWTSIDMRWNVSTALLGTNAEVLVVVAPDELDRARLDPGIVHFTGKNPWDPASNHPWKERWLEVAADTAWRDSLHEYRYEGMSVPYRVRYRVRRAWRVLVHG